MTNNNNSIIRAVSPGLATKKFKNCSQLGIHSPSLYARVTSVEKGNPKISILLCVGERAFGRRDQYSEFCEDQHKADHSYDDSLPTKRDAIYSLLIKWVLLLKETIRTGKFRALYGEIDDNSV